MTQAIQLSDDASIIGMSRVLIISDAAPHRNGVGAYYADLMTDLVGYVEKIHMLSPEVVGDKWRGGWSLPLPGDKTQKVCLPNIFELQRAIKLFRPTVVVVPTPGLYGLVGAWLAKRSGIPVILGFHTWFEKLASLYWRRLQGGVTKTYFELVNKTLFMLADRTLANSHEMVEIARQHGAPNTSLMGTPLSRILLDKPLGPIPKKLSKVLFIGRLAAEKNVAAVIDAARCFPSIQFTIAGDGPERGLVEQLANGVANVKLLGWVGREEIVELIDSHDVLVLPSKVESFGTVAMEAMVRQRLVVVSQACGITEWPELNTALTVIDADSTLSDALGQCKQLSEFEFYSQCTLGRKQALGHIQWNRQTWLSCLAAQAHTSMPQQSYIAELISSIKRSI